jgi:uncharacterized protein (TIGR02145 family)
MGGFGLSGGSFSGVGNNGNWWSATENNSSSIYNREMYYNFEYVGRNLDDKSILYSVRCVQDVLCGDKVYDPATQVCDSRDSKVYKKTKIGTQTWMAENLNYNAAGSRCYGDNTGGDSQNRCDTYGRLYDWATAMNLPTSCNSSDCSSLVQSKRQGVCPSGWHLPSDAELDDLIAFVHSDNGLAVYTSGGSTLAGKYLKAESGWNGTMVNDDKYGFSALPGGRGYSGDNFLNVGDYGTWWSATAYNSNSNDDYNMGMSYNNENANRALSAKGNMYSVRCVQD